MKKKPTPPDEMRMKSEDFDRIMRGVLKPEQQPKAKKARKKKAAKAE